MTTYPFELIQYPNSIFELQKSVWNGNIFLHRDEEILEPYDVKNKLYILQMENGDEVNLQIKESFPSGIYLMVNGVRQDIVSSIKWYNYLLCIVPLSLIFIAGLLGAVIGGGATGLNLSIMQKMDKVNKLITYGKVIAVNIAVYLVYLFIASSI
ncbi:hypothetical protein EDC17_101650 [Sphingobacterium alimentarium]|uniref:Uncharacterized protein n=1 Tax=Sphingobacterium alimentarium TaxID=797292 RepID=A0A4R3VY46_9SPHI|nr:hypothetical protein [Sphingobacterium alimentarium]TCV14145.1 hypothetical protein EDC17_101650 [Sphingobacterium alimentarium]